MAMRFPIDALRASTAFLPMLKIIIAAMIAPIKPIGPIAFVLAREIGAAGSADRTPPNSFP
jgi:hypothetical protein